MRYKTVQFGVDFELIESLLQIVDSHLAEQPAPRPFIEPSRNGCVFHFHFLDMRLLKDSAEGLTVDLIFTSPPYNFGLDEIAEKRLADLTVKAKTA